VVPLIPWLSLAAHAATIPVATSNLDPGQPVRAADLRWVEVPDDHPLAVDVVADPEGLIVIERVLEGEILRTERLLDVEKPERIAVPGMRALRVPGIDHSFDIAAGERADLWILTGDEPCTLVQGTWILGIGRNMTGLPDSTILLVSPEKALQLMASNAPMQVRPVSAATANTPRPELACSP